MKNLVFSIITLGITIILIFLFGEIMVRISTSPFVPTDERSLLYQYDQKLGWFPIPNSENEFRGSQKIIVKNNELGFRDGSYVKKEKPRIAFIGDSFVWGYDVEQNERFTEVLQTKLPNWEILNMGVSGYGTDQSFLLLQRWFDYFKPDIIFLVFFNGNDEIENSTNNSYGFYKPYYTVIKNKIRLKGVPVPLSIVHYKKKYPLLFKSKLIEFLTKCTLPKKLNLENPTPFLIKEINKFVLSKGATFHLAFVNKADQDLNQCSFCKTENIENLFLTNPFVYENAGKHWTPEGHRFAAEKLFEFLKKKQPDRIKQ